LYILPYLYFLESSYGVESSNLEYRRRVENMILAWL